MDFRMSDTEGKGVPEDEDIEETLTQVYSDIAVLNDAVVALKLQPEEEKMTLLKSDKFKRLFVRWAHHYKKWWEDEREGYIMEHGDSSIRSFICKLSESNKFPFKGFFSC